MEGWTNFVCIKVGIHDSEGGIRMLANITPEEHGYASFDHLDHHALKIADFRVHVCRVRCQTMNFGRFCLELTQDRASSPHITQFVDRVQLLVRVPRIID